MRALQRAINDKKLNAKHVTFSDNTVYHEDTPNIKLSNQSIIPPTEDQIKNVSDKCLCCRICSIDYLQKSNNDVTKAIIRWQEEILGMI
jgi:hypothetical protein